MQALQTIDLTPQSIHQAAEILKRGGVVAVPTETVYGLAARFDSESAVRAVFAAKGRPADNPLIVHCASVEQLATIGVMTNTAWRLAEAFMPGPLTLVLDAAIPVSTIVTGGLSTVALRVPSHPLLRRLIELAGVPLAAPSANVSGRPSPTSASHVRDDLNGRIDAILDGGPCQHGMESTVVDCRHSTAVLLRPGALPASEIERVLGHVLGRTSDSGGGSPGMRYRHYAPRASIRCVTTMESMRLALDEANERHEVVCGIIPVATSFYADLRAADALNVEQIVVLCDHVVQADEVLMNRLRKASEPSQPVPPPML